MRSEGTSLFDPPQAAKCLIALAEFDVQFSWPNQLIAVGSNATAHVHAEVRSNA